MIAEVLLVRNGTGRLERSSSCRLWSPVEATTAPHDETRSARDEARGRGCVGRRKGVGRDAFHSGPAARLRNDASTTAKKGLSTKRASGDRRDLGSGMPADFVKRSRYVAGVASYTRHESFLVPGLGEATGTGGNPAPAGSEGTKGEKEELTQANLEPSKRKQMGRQKKERK